MFSQLSERHYFPISILKLQFARWFYLGDLPALFLAYSVSACPQLTRAASWIFQMGALLRVMRNLDEAFAGNTTDYS